MQHQRDTQVPLMDSNGNPSFQQRLSPKPNSATLRDQTSTIATSNTKRRKTTATATAAAANTSGTSTTATTTIPVSDGTTDDTVMSSSDLLVGDQTNAISEQAAAENQLSLAGGPQSIQNLHFHQLLYNHYTNNGNNIVDDVITPTSARPFRSANNKSNKRGRSCSPSETDSTTISTEDHLRTQAKLSLQSSLVQLAESLLSLSSTSINPDLKHLNLTPKDRHQTHQQIETQRQVFTLSFLLRTYKPSHDLVIPRSDIYDDYAQLCKELGLKPLSPATVGKLIRVVFPDVETRRLGSRGKSKYHYVGLGRPIVGSKTDDHGSEKASMTKSTATASTSASSGSSSSSGGKTPSVAPPPKPHPSIELTSTDTARKSEKPNSSKNGQISLCFIPTLIKSLNCQAAPPADFQIQLPPLLPHVPESSIFSNATVKSLSESYTKYCTSIFNDLRFLQFSKLQSSIMEFPKSLTEMERELYFSEWSLSWIEMCDKLTYQFIIKMLAKLALQKIPPHVILILKQISEAFATLQGSSLSESGCTSQKLFTLKTYQSEIFTRLITRLIRVSETAQSTMTILSRPEDLQLMRNDWLKFVPCEEIIRKELPVHCQLVNNGGGAGSEIVLKILKHDIPELLQSDDLTSATGPSSQYNQPQPHILQRLADYISYTLPLLFQQQAAATSTRQISPRILTLCISVVLTSALREISLAGGAGFGAWWVTRCWVDEWVGWCGELGGVLGGSAAEAGEVFMEQQVKHPVHRDEEEEDNDDNEEEPEEEVGMNSHELMEEQLNQLHGGVEALHEIGGEIEGNNDGDDDEIAEEDKVGFDSTGDEDN
ncbi:hypothetical protein WICPIJ_004114 [Wickerhamomyces pijperi]|uniref:RFX-type winged-helix domain-containing protein n=1 Tax=Wickerhamomyces pijperi TaxID=599730 RepID=A0A9P8Q5W5_WICPI|nr:hypothetical protein WICPIJ_004114 [Wickerhamomyces pijperi]